MFFKTLIIASIIASPTILFSMENNESLWEATKKEEHNAFSRRLEEATKEGNKEKIACIQQEQRKQKAFFASVENGIVPEELRQTQPQNPSVNAQNPSSARPAVSDIALATSEVFIPIKNIGGWETKASACSHTIVFTETPENAKIPSSARPAVSDIALATSEVFIPIKSIEGWKKTAQQDRSMLYQQLKEAQNHNDVQAAARIVVQIRTITQDPNAVDNPLAKL